jgi:hypothetical protein
MSAKHLSRKWLLALLTVLSATGLVMAEKISDDVYSVIVISALGTYATANVVQKRTAG